MNRNAMTPEQIRERLMKATHGPWRVVDRPSRGVQIEWGGSDDGEERPVAHMRWTDGMRPVVEARVAADAALIANAPTDIALLLSLLDQRDAEIARLASQARDISQYLAEAKVGACPIPEGVRLLLNRAEHAESSLLRMTEEREGKPLLKSVKVKDADGNWTLAAHFYDYGYFEQVQTLARLTEAHERLKGLSAKWRERAVSITSDFQVMRDDRVKARILRESADDLDALLTPPEEKKDDDGSVARGTPVTLPSVRATAPTDRSKA